MTQKPFATLVMASAVLSALLTPHALAGSPATLDGWAALETPGGQLPFAIILTTPDKDFATHGLEGKCWIGSDEDPYYKAVRWSMRGDDFVIHFDHYGSEIIANWNSDHTKLAGAWKKDRGDKGFAVLPFKADFTRLPGDLFTSGRAFGNMNMGGRWAIDFDDDSEDAVANFEMGTRGQTRATIMTTTGDYRFLRGMAAYTEMRLAAFDGAHAFLYHASLQPDNVTIKGDFWSGDWYHTKFTGTKKVHATLPDGFKQSRWLGTSGPVDLTFPDLDGNMRELFDPEFMGKATIIDIFGSWCPNCSDAAELLSEYKAIYGDRGLKIIGLAFEISDDLEQNATRIRAHMKRNNVDWPVLIGGRADKKLASDAVPFLDRIHAYPTLLFIDSNGEARYVYSGFFGPATKEEHVAMRSEFENIIEELLNEE